MSHSVHYGGKQGSHIWGHEGHEGPRCESLRSNCGKLFCFGRGIDVASLATHIVTPFLGPYSKPPG